MFVVTHAGETEEFSTMAQAQEWIIVLLRNKVRFEVTYRY